MKSVSYCIWAEIHEGNITYCVLKTSKCAVSSHCRSSLARQEKVRKERWFIGQQGSGVSLQEYKKRE